ncbi:Gfo/Idh/MocA family oxidoreductase [Gracilibacillus oryzae]|uniref:Gfo/Idh/MocA family oxidoreductase n=1 Tax=Gracilibacillus oryzae TaxID=1672701 RepID=A0A7C8KY12_9BACI|nr:Gfo/Idh/MocA family oxidoreductase [Gracilibacillus oryzae]KAB8139240.1 Gfo/Idh/MocA family oxidoreductase [Gracilibacillus oryzae]
MINLAIISENHERVHEWMKIEHVDIAAILLTEGVDSNQIPKELKHKLVHKPEDILSMDVDLVDLCVPAQVKPDMIRQLYKEGLHIFTETPLATDANLAATLYKECKDKMVGLYVGNTIRFSPEFLEARKHVENGQLGRTGVNRISSKDKHPGDNADIFLELGAPVFDWLYWTFGEVERVIAKQVQKQRKDGSPVEYALIDLRHEDQTFSHVELSWAGSEKQMSFELTGNQGMLENDSKNSQPIVVEGAADIALEEQILGKTAIQRELDHVVQVIKQSQKPIVTTEDAIKAVKITDAVKKSVSTGQPVELKEGVIL